MNESEKLNYVKALMYIALADDSIEKEEEEYLNQVGLLYGLTKEQLTEIKFGIINRTEKIEEILLNVGRRELKLTFLYDMLALCYVDNNYSIVERQGMSRICDIMGIERTKLTEIEQIMEEQLALQKRINLILER